MALTRKQEEFCQAIADGMNQSDAYRKAYSTEKMKPVSINVNASKLMADANVALRVKELKGALSQKALWTRENAVSELVSIVTLSKGAGQFGAATGAIKELNNMHGYNEAVKVEVEHNGKVGFAHDVIFNVSVVSPKTDEEERV